MRLKGLPIVDGYSTKWKRDYEIWLYTQIVAWGKQSKYLNIQCFSEEIWEHVFMDELETDVYKLTLAITFITVYSYLVLGNFSPIHMRAASALVGMTCVGLAVTSGYGIAAFAG